MTFDLKRKCIHIQEDGAALPPIERVLLFLIFVTSSMFVLQISGKYVSLLLEVVFCGYMLCKKKRIILPGYFLITFIFIELFFAAGSALLSDMPQSYKKTAVDLAIMALPSYVTICYIREFIKEGYDVFGLVIKAIKMMVVIQIGWFLLQAVLWYGMHIDLNNIVFVRLLHTVSNASFVRSWVFYPSGLTWHSAILAPMLVLAYILFEKPHFRVLILLVAVLCGNSTALIGTVLTAVMVWLFQIYVMSGKAVRKRLLMVVAVAVAALLGLYVTGSFSRVSGIAINLYKRLFGSEKDASTAAHFGYYTDYLKIFPQSTIPQIFFGYGYGCSGYTITRLYSRYKTLASWAIESDVINIIVSRGIVGFLAYYIFLFYVMLKGLRTDIRYFIFMAVIFIQGFGYNIQFEYVFMIEMLLFVSLEFNDNFFRHGTRGENKQIVCVRMEGYRYRGIKENAGFDYLS